MLSRQQLKRGVFESVLAIVLGVVTGKEVQSAHDLARKALKSKKYRPSNGVIKYVPPKDD